MVFEQGSSRQAWLVLSLAAFLSVAIFLLSLDGALSFLERQMAERDRIAMQKIATDRSSHTRVLSAGEAATLRQSSRITTHARLLSDPAQIFGIDAYPAAAIEAGEQGRAIAHLTVSQTGSVRACAILSGSGSTTLDAATCRHADRMMFDPARNANGEAVASEYRLPVRWQIPSQ